MCEPATIMYAVTLVTAGYGVYTEGRNADRQERASRKAQEVQEEQINDKLGAEATDRARMARKERARLRAASAESGLTGMTLDTLMNDVSFQEGYDTARMTKNAENSINSSRTQLDSNLNSITQPDYLGTAVNAGLQIYGDQQNQGKT